MGRSQHIKVNSNMIFRLGKCTKKVPFYPFGERGTYSAGNPFKNVSLKEGALLEGSYFAIDVSH